MRFVIAFFIVAIFCQAIIHCPAGQQGGYGAAQWQSEEEKNEFHKLLRKHGQDKQVSVIYYEGVRAYFINEKGEKCLFK